MRNVAAACPTVVSNGPNHHKHTTPRLPRSQDSEDDISLLKPTGFRAGLYNFMTGKGSLAATAGTAVVTQITGDVNETFKKVSDWCTCATISAASTMDVCERSTFLANPF